MFYYKYYSLKICNDKGYTFCNKGRQYVTQFSIYVSIRHTILCHRLTAYNSLHERHDGQNSKSESNNGEIEALSDLCPVPFYSFHCVINTKARICQDSEVRKICFFFDLNNILSLWMKTWLYIFCMGKIQKFIIKPALSRFSFARNDFFLCQ